MFWGEAVVTAIHLLNRSLTKSLQGKTPYEAWYGRAPAVAHLRVFGCLCFAKEPNQVRKLDDHSRPGVFIGYTDGAKAYRVYDPVSRRVLMSRDVIFDETRGWDWSGSAAHAALVVQELVFDDFDDYLPAPGETGSAASTGAVPTPRGGVHADPWVHANTDPWGSADPRSRADAHVRADARARADARVCADTRVHADP